MTDRKELEKLQKGARAAGRIANFCIDSSGYIDAVAYLDPKGGPRTRAGCILSPLVFAEMEREKLGPKREKRKYFCG